MISNLNNGMMTKIWGPAGWLFLHCVTYGYPLNPENNDIQNGISVGKTRQNYKDFFLRIGDVLPCKYCRDSYKKFIITDPITPNLNNRNLLTKWLWRIHNRVNEKLGDHYCDADFKTINLKYESYRAKCTPTTPFEKLINIKKGCILPKDGMPKKCHINIVTSNNNYNNIINKIILLIIGILIGFNIKRFYR